MLLLVSGYLLKKKYFSLSYKEVEPEENIKTEDGNEDIPERYNRRQSIIMMIVFFILSLCLSYIIFTYTAGNYYLYAKLSILNGIIAAAAITDFKSSKIPNELIIFGICARIVIYVAEFILARSAFWRVLKNDFFGFLIGFVFLFLVAVITKGGIGYGDVKLFGIIGILSGSAGVAVILFLSLLINSIVAIVLLILKRKTLKSTLPMAPFIYMGFFLACILGMF